MKQILTEDRGGRLDRQKLFSMAGEFAVRESQIENLKIFFVRNGNIFEKQGDCDEVFIKTSKADIKIQSKRIPLK